MLQHHVWLISLCGANGHSLAVVFDFNFRYKCRKFLVTELKNEITYGTVHVSQQNLTHILFLRVFGLYG
jgi:hypothetical protein